MLNILYNEVQQSYRRFKVFSILQLFPNHFILDILPLASHSKLTVQILIIIFLLILIFLSIYSITISRIPTKIGVAGVIKYCRASFDGAKPRMIRCIISWLNIKYSAKYRGVKIHVFHPYFSILRLSLLKE